MYRTLTAHIKGNVLVIHYISYLAGIANTTGELVSQHVLFYQIYNVNTTLLIVLLLLPFPQLCHYATHWYWYES